MIRGTGIDLMDPARIERAAERWGDPFLDRLFSSGERRLCEGRAEPWLSFAARFAAKEAFMKALGLGLRRGLTWRQMEVASGPEGRPELRLSGRAADLMKEAGARRVHLSRSHLKGMAAAMVVLEGEGP